MLKLEVIILKDSLMLCQILSKKVKQGKWRWIKEKVGKLQELGKISF